MPITIFPIISLKKLKVAIAIINNVFIEANMIMNSSAKFQLYPPYSFWGVNFLVYVCKFNLLVAMATYPIERFG